jgi:hypothetical protein
MRLTTGVGENDGVPRAQGQWITRFPTLLASFTSMRCRPRSASRRTSTARCSCWPAIFGAMGNPDARHDDAQSPQIFRNLIDKSADVAIAERKMTVQLRPHSQRYHVRSFQDALAWDETVADGYRAISSQVRLPRVGGRSIYGPTQYRLTRRESQDGAERADQAPGQSDAALGG